MRRREIIAALAGAAAAALIPRFSTAQPGCCRIVGVLAPNPKVFATVNLEHDLRELGWEAGRDYRIVFRASAGSNRALPGLAAELVGLPADVILAAGDQAVIAAQRATAAIPIVGICDDMVGSNLVSSMARPGGNTTGISILASELDVKRLELLNEIVPGAARIGILADPTTVATGPQLAVAARALKLDLITAEATDAPAVAGALERLAAAGVGAVNVRASPILDDARDLIIERLAQARLPAMYQWPESAEAGGFAGYGPRLATVIRAAVQTVDKLLRGASPTAIPVQQPTAFELAINLKTAKSLGLAVPPAIHARADRVVE